MSETFRSTPVWCVPTCPCHREHLYDQSLMACVGEPPTLAIVDDQKFSTNLKIGRVGNGQISQNMEWVKIKEIQSEWKTWPKGPGPDGYPRVLDYSIFKSLLVPYSKNFTTRSSSRVVTISYFLSNHSNIQKMEM